MFSSLRFILKGAQLSHPCTRTLVGAFLSVWFFGAFPSRAESGGPIRIDASQPFTEPGPARSEEGSAKSPSGSTLGVTSRYLTLSTIARQLLKNSRKTERGAISSWLR